jgi:hypothetical protein
MRRLYESAFVQFDFRAANHQLLHKEGIAEPEDGADAFLRLDRRCPIAPFSSDYDS